MSALDDAALEQLRMLDRKRPGLLARVVQRYLDDATPRLRSATDALTRGALPELAEVAHALKGDSRLLGAELVAGCAEALEQAARGYDAIAARAALSNLPPLVEGACAALRALPELTRR